MQSEKKLRKQITELMMGKLDQVYEELGLAVTKKSSKKHEKLVKKVAKSLAASKRKMDKKALKAKVQPKVEVEPEVPQEVQDFSLLNGKRPSPHRKNPADKVA